MDRNLTLPPNGLLKRRRHLRLRRGFTLAETLVATAIVATLTAALGSLIYSATSAATHVTAVRQTQHHGRRCTDRLGDLIRSAHSSRQFPGAIVVTSTSGTTTFSDVLALWMPTGAPQAPTGRPRIREILFIGPSPSDPSKLMQFRRTSDSGIAPTWNDSAGWTALSASVRSDPASATEIWTDLLHRATIATESRGNIHFHARSEPTNQHWQQYLAGTRTWENLSWPMYGGGSQTGVRIVAVTFEMQLEPPTEEGSKLSAFDRGVFFGAATLKTVLEK